MLFSRHGTYSPAMLWCGCRERVLDFGSQTYEELYFCCLKPQGLWSFATTVTEISWALLTAVCLRVCMCLCVYMYSCTFGVMHRCAHACKNQRSISSDQVSFSFSIDSSFFFFGDNRNIFLHRSHYNPG